MTQRKTSRRKATAEKARGGWGVFQQLLRAKGTIRRIGPAPLSRFILSTVHGRRATAPLCGSSVAGSRGASAIQRPAQLRHSLCTAAISSDVDVARDDTGGRRGGAGEVNSKLGDFCDGRRMEERRIDTPAMRMRRTSDWYTFLLLLPCCFSSLSYFPLASLNHSL